MSTSESPRPALSEDDVHRLLIRFFEDELPVELRSPRLTRFPASPTADPSPMQRDPWAAAVLPLGLLCCVLAVALLVQPQTPPSAESTTRHMLPASPNEFAAPRGSATGLHAPGVERQTHLVPAGAEAGDSQPTPEIEVMIPELEVELFPPPSPGSP